MEYPYHFSVIMPIYNVEAYLEKAILSMVNQTIGFESHIQLVLVNDGSPDHCDDICRRYQALYPDNIIYIEQKNGGVSKARNTGLDAAQGKYIAFLDPDDLWEKNAFLNARHFFEEYGDEADVVAGRIKFFEANDDYHSLDFKFNKGARVADLRWIREIFLSQSTAATCFIRHEALGDIRFDTMLKHGEDSIFINKIILKKCKLGLLPEALYLYRKRAAGDSAVDNQLYKKEFYTTPLVNYHLELIHYSQQLYGEVLPYVQAMIAYDLLWRFGNDRMKGVLTKDELKVYDARVSEILSFIDDYAIFNQPRHGSINKMADAIYYKYGTDLYKDVYLYKGTLQYKQFKLFNIAQNKSKCVQVVGATILNNTLKIEMLIAQWILRCGKENHLIFYVNKEPYAPTFSTYTVQQSKTRQGEEDYYTLATVEIPVDAFIRHHGDTLTVVPKLNIDGTESTISLSYGKYVPNTLQFEPVYQKFDNYLLKAYKHSMKVYCPKYEPLMIVKWDNDCRQYLERIGREDVAELRYHRLPLFKAKNKLRGDIWLISDRIDNAGDNGEVLFKYICEHKPKGVRPIFVIGEEASDAVKARLRGIGEVLPAEDPDYPLYFLCATKIISSSAGEFTINPFENDMCYYRDLCRFRYYFMNHGVNCGDCSKWLNKYNKNMRIFFTTGESERQNIIDRDYNLAPEQVQITGLARFDALYEDTKKQLLILPTWRRAYKNCYDKKTTASVYYDGFKETAYYRFYNGLMQDERLLAAMRRHGYTGLLCLHPIFKEQARDFEANDVFTVNEGFVDYNKVFAESAVMVTDYSTIAFDFAYLNKPIVYTQFDKKEFYANQVYNECFDYENEGFGPICETLDSAVNALVKLIENDCQNPWLDRIDRFFVHHDRSNAARILEAVLNDN